MEEDTHLKWWGTLVRVYGTGALAGRMQVSRTHIRAPTVEITITACSVAAICHTICNCRTRTVVSLIFPSNPERPAESNEWYLAKGSP